MTTRGATLRGADEVPAYAKLRHPLVGGQTELRKPPPYMMNNSIFAVSQPGMIFDPAYGTAILPMWQPAFMDPNKVPTDAQELTSNYPFIGSKFVESVGAAEGLYDEALLKNVFSGTLLRASWSASGNRDQRPAAAQSK